MALLLLFVVVHCFRNDECLRFASWKSGKQFDRKFQNIFSTLRILDPPMEGFEPV